MGFLINLYGPYGFVALIVSILAWVISHSFFIKGMKNIDFSVRTIGFITFVSIFIISGWKAGLFAVPIIIIASFLGAIIAKAIKRKEET